MNDPNYIYIGNLSPDAKRVVRRWFAKFCGGTVEHGPLDLSTFTLPNVLHACTQEMQDLTSYLAMVQELIAEVREGGNESKGLAEAEEPAA